MPVFLFRGASVHYTVHGDGPALLLVHGAGGNGMNWSPQLRRLAGHRVAAIDLPGHGKSIDAPPLANISDFAALVLAWADALGAHTFAIAGQSLGGAIALQVTLDAPERVTHLFPIACAPKINVNPALLDALEADDPTIYTALTRSSYARSTPPERLAQYEAHLRKTPPNVLWRAFSACSTFDVTGRLHEITASTLVFGAQEDRMIPVQGSVDLHHAIRGSHLQLVEGAGHMIHIESSETITTAVASYYPVHR